MSNSFGDGAETSALQYCLFTCPGSIYPTGKSNLTFKPLLSSRGGPLAGTTSVDNFWTGGVFGTPRRFNPDRTLYPGNNLSEVIGASISGEVKDGNQTNQMKVILVADSDVLADPFFNIRSRGPDSDSSTDVDNVTLSLNLIDSLSGENSLLEIRNVVDCIVHWKNLKRVLRLREPSHLPQFVMQRLPFNKSCKTKIES